MTRFTAGCLLALAAVSVAFAEEAGRLRADGAAPNGSGFHAVWGANAVWGSVVAGPDGDLRRPLQSALA